jgi:hypothetical protein
MSRRIFFAGLFGLVCGMMLYMEIRAYGAIYHPGIWDLVAVLLPCAIAFEGVVLACWAWVDDGRLSALERKT